ncbi:MAG: ribonuclease E inhibitor RraB [Piscinibacter sp.]
MNAASPIRRRAVLARLGAVAVAAAVPLVHAQAMPRIQLAEMERLFANLRTRTAWNVDGPLLWGYFFYDASTDKLDKAGAALVAAGYTLVGVEQPPGSLLYRLHVTRVEAHTPASLHARNQELYAFAEKFSLDSYDGMDVGPVP